MMNKTLAALLAATAAACVSVAYADDAASAPQSRHQVDKQADAQHKADVKSAEATHAIDKSQCGSSLTATGRACKDDAGAAERKAKADAKVKQVDTKAGN